MHRVVALVPLLIVGLFAVMLGTPRALGLVQEATPAADCPVTTEEENEAIARRWHEEMINGANPAVADEIAASDIIHHAGTLPDGVGTEAVKFVLDVLLTGFPDVQHTIEQVLSDGEFVVIRWQADGTHAGEFQGYAPTNKPVTWTGVNIYRFACGKIAEEWTEVDGLGRLQQLGLVATPTP
jgi:predicted ester cyclase